ncbi:MAG TPA: DUF3999 family protein [Opitutaceae bacterium]|nr:DUF3999 family protein [Opitutaceae bacterium]HND62587.1 DUF3999 family protein [Opitutaceae bacterium]
MNRRLLPRPERVLILAVLGAALSAAALTPTDWPQRQPLTVTTPGLTRVVLPAATFDLAQPGLGDLRLIDAAGREVPYLLDTPPAVAVSAADRQLAPRSFRATPGPGGTVIEIETGTDAPLEAVELESPTAFFLKAAHVDVSADGSEWRSLGAALPVFRQFGAEQLALELDGKPAARVRVTLDNYRTPPIQFTGARLRRTPRTTPAQPETPLGATISRREEYVGETVLTVTLEGRNAPLTRLSLDADEKLFMRAVTVAVRESRGSTSEEVTVASGTIYRVALDGAPVRAGLDLPLSHTPAGRELLVHIHNGDSPPLKVTGLRVMHRPVNLLFIAPAAGTYHLIAGNSQATPPRYDLSTFAGDLRTATATAAAVRDAEPMPDYRPAPALPEVSLNGAPLDAQAWRDRRAVHIDRPGVQELELDPAALARARWDYADVRLLRGANQVPYLLERPNLSRALNLEAAMVPDAKHPSVSVWRLTLPQAGLPVDGLVLTTSAPLFQRQFRIFERLPGRDGHDYERQLGGGEWSRTPEPGQAPTRRFRLDGRPESSQLWITTDNGDNPAIELGSVQLTYPVVRLVFQAAASDGYVLAVHNPDAVAPRYDLSLVATRLLAATRQPAQLTSTDIPAPATERLTAMHQRYLFWGVLALVVIALLAIVAKLLPKPPAG